MDYVIYNNDPVVNLTPYRKPVFRDQTLYDLQPKDRIALWVVMHPRTGSNVPTASGLELPNPPPAGDCCAGGDSHPHEPSTDAPQAGPQLAFYDPKSGQRLLEVPILFRGPGGDHVGAH